MARGKGTFYIVQTKNISSDSYILNNYSKGDELVLPGDDTDLENYYTTADVTKISTEDDNRVGQTGSTFQFILHQFKDNVGTNNSCSLIWEGQSTLAPSSFPVYLQIYNRDTTTWDTIDSDSSSDADTDFILTKSSIDLTNYKDVNNIISCRVYQENTI